MLVNTEMSCSRCNGLCHLRSKQVYQPHVSQASSLYAVNHLVNAQQVVGDHDESHHAWPACPTGYEYVVSSQTVYLGEATCQAEVDPRGNLLKAHRPAQGRPEQSP